jgi:Family of unknown function (DUF5677)
LVGHDINRVWMYATRGRCLVPQDETEPPYSVLLSNLQSIREWIDAHRELPVCRDNDEFMTLGVEIMRRAHYLLKVGISLSPSPQVASRGMSKNRAIVVGHLVRLMKLYDCFLLHTCEKHLEICMIFFRLILETAIRLEYLLTAKRATFKSFILTSYRPEKEHLVDLKAKARQRRLTPIEKRILGSVTTHMMRDGIRQKALLMNRSWDLDGKSFRALLQSIGHADWGYSYGFGNGSHFVHGDWRDIIMHHVRRRGRFYEPKWQYSTPDPRVTGPTTKICLYTLLCYVRWNKCDPDNLLRPIIEELKVLNGRLDAAHERYWREQLS